MDLDTILGEGAGEEELEGDMDDVRRLGLVWVRERGTADIMRWEGDLIDSVFDKLEQQVSSSFHLSITQFQAMQGARRKYLERD
jgi:hypothetical protein